VVEQHQSCAFVVLAGGIEASFPRPLDVVEDEREEVDETLVLRSRRRRAGGRAATLQVGDNVAQAASTEERNH
jgi:hypothetical protein